MHPQHEEDDNNSDDNSERFLSIRSFMWLSVVQTHKQFVWRVTQSWDDSGDCCISLCTFYGETRPNYFEKRKLEKVINKRVSVSVRLEMVFYEYVTTKELLELELPDYLSSWEPSESLFYIFTLRIRFSIYS